VKKFVTCIMVAACLPAFADDSADVKAVQQLADKYYETTRKAKDIEDIVPLMAKKNKQKVHEQPVPKELHEMAMQMLRSHVPITYKIVSQKVEPDRVTLVLESGDFPKDQMIPLPKDSVANGEFVAIKEEGEWKVYKDYWSAKSKDGSEKTTFGTNPDAEHESTSSK
jgi:hypothetical protein